MMALRPGVTTTLDQAKDPAALSLLGGPLHRLGCRLGLVRAGTNTVRLGLAIGVCLWAVLMVLSLAEGINPLSLDLLGVHTALLVMTPLLFLCETRLDPRVTQFMHSLQRSQLVPSAAQPALQNVIARTTRWTNAWLPEALCLSLALALTWALSQLQITGVVRYGRDAAETGAAMAGWWYWSVCLSVVRFLLLRWAWRLCLWFHCLWQLSRLPLQLRAGHPDGVAGLGFLEVVHGHFLPLVLAISVELAASFAADIAAGTMALEAAYPAILAIVLVDGLLFVGPLFVFSPSLWACRVNGLVDYMAFAERYVGDFEAKWLRSKARAGEPMLGSADIQSLADLGNTVERVRDMRVVPVSSSLLVQIALTALLPMMPLALFKYPLADLAKEIFSRLAGL
jgi:hypothetical protein